MLKIKLARFGKRNQPHYRIVVNEARTKRDGKYIALLGHYAPTQTPKTLEINMESYNEWVKKGAQPTDTVAGLAKRFESGNPFPKKKAKLSKKAKAKLASDKVNGEAREGDLGQKAEAAKPKEEVVETKEETKTKEVAPEAKTEEKSEPKEEAVETKEEPVEEKSEVQDKQTEKKTK